MAAASAPLNLVPQLHPDPRTCGAATRSRDGFCRNPRGFKTPHPTFGQCHLHGGNTKNGKISAAREELEALTAGRPTDPLVAVQEAVDKESGLMDFLERKIEALHPDEIVTAGELNAWVRLHRDTYTRRAHLGKLAADAGVQERQVRLAEQFVGDVANVLDFVLSRLGVRNHPDAPEVVRQGLRLIDSTGAQKELVA